MKKPTPQEIDPTFINQISPSWPAVLNFLDSTPIHTVSSFDLFISKKEGHELEVQLRLPHHEHTKAISKIPVSIPAALYDLYW